MRFPPCRFFLSPPACSLIKSSSIIFRPSFSPYSSFSPAFGIPVWILSPTTRLLSWNASFYFVSSPKVLEIPVKKALLSKRWHLVAKTGPSSFYNLLFRVLVSVSRRVDRWLGIQHAYKSWCLLLLCFWTQNPYRLMNFRVCECTCTKFCLDL